MNKPFIVAEMSANHLGDFARALALVDAAADAGADAIKIQTWSPDTMCIDQTYTLASGSWAGRRLFYLYREAWLPWDWHPAIFARAAERGIECFSSPFDRASVDFLESLGCPRYKIASFELVDLDLIGYVANKGKPMIMSTGMATLDEICDAKRAACRAGCEDLTLLKCTSAYPAPAEDAHLVAMANLKTEFGCKFGLSDHTLGHTVAVAAVSLGASMIEKHLTLSCADGGPDAGFSMEPNEFAQMVTECRRAAAAIGEVKYGPGPSESTALRRSLWVSRDIKAGEEFRFGLNFVTARPALGESPEYVNAFDCGGRAKHDIKAGTPLLRSMVCR